jgi:hypothetical protein
MVEALFRGRYTSTKTPTSLTPSLTLGGHRLDFFLPDPTTSSQPNLFFLYRIVNNIIARRLEYNNGVFYYSKHKPAYSASRDIPQPVHY